MSIHSAGILLYRFVGERLEVLLVHPGGPYWTNKDEHAWTVPKGLCEPDETPLDAARREFREETGFEAIGEFIELGQLKQPSRKIVHVWAVEQDVDTSKLVSNHFDLEWPRNSGVVKAYPEADKGQWFDIEDARKMMLRGQVGFLDRLIQTLFRRQ